MKNIIKIEGYEINTPISDFTPSPEKLVGRKEFYLDKYLNIFKVKKHRREYTNISDTDYIWMRFNNCDLKDATIFMERLFSYSYERAFTQYIIYQEGEYFYACYTYSTTPMSLWAHIVNRCIRSFQRLLIPLRFHMPEKSSVLYLK